MRINQSSVIIINPNVYIFIYQFEFVYIRVFAHLHNPHKNPMTTKT